MGDDKTIWMMSRGSTGLYVSPIRKPAQISSMNHNSRGRRPPTQTRGLAFMGRGIESFSDDSCGKCGANFGQPGRIELVLKLQQSGHGLPA